MAESYGITQPWGSYNPDFSANGSINPPDLNAQLKPQRRALKDAKQARNIILTLEHAARERNVRNARIQSKINSEKPFRQDALEADGLGWKSNFTSKPLPMLVNKVAPRFRKAIESVKYLTNSALPDNVPGNALKTEAFRREITKLIRTRPGWSDFIGELSLENVLFGFAGAAWLDEFSWMPKFYRQDMFFVPTGTKQQSSGAQLVCIREKYLIHELFSLIEDKEAAANAGWNIQNAVDAINKAMPENRRSQWFTWERVYEDLIREANVGMSHESGALIVPVWHVLAQEVTGKVSHYIFREQGIGIDSDTLFEREDQFDSMSDAVAFFSFEQGNGTLHGSKGIGREIYSMAAMLDRARNEIVDRLNLAGKLIIQADDKALRRFKMSVVGCAMLIGQGYQISERKIDTAIEPFLQLDQFLTSLLDQIAGAVTPKALEGERVTAAAVNLLSGREEESRDNVIGRFLGQFAPLIGTMQKRICSPETGEDDAKDFQKRMLEIMSREELTTLANQPVAETVADYTMTERQQIVMIAQEGKGNPLFNQRELERRSLTAQVNDEFADAVLLPDEDPTVTAEQTRLQQLELMLIAGHATQVPISPRDNHMVHLQVLIPAMEQAAQVAAQQPDGVPILGAMLMHAQGHFQGAQQDGTPKDKLKQVGQIISKLGSAMQQLQQLAQGQQMAEAGAALHANNADNTHPAEPATDDHVAAAEAGAGAAPQ